MSGDPLDVIPGLLKDLSHAFDRLRLETERLRGQEGLPTMTERPLGGRPPLANDLVTQAALAFSNGEDSGAEVTDAPVKEQSALSSALRPRQRRLSPPAPAPQALDVAKPLGDSDMMFHADHGDYMEELKPIQGEVTPMLPAQSARSDPGPKHGTLLPAWDPAMGAVMFVGTQASAASADMRMGSIGRNSQPDVARLGDVVESTGFGKYLVVTPNTWKVNCWDLLSVVALSIDLFLSPMTVFGVDPRLELSLFTAVFWSFDILLRCCLGYYDQGVVEMRLRKILANYVRNTFFFDTTMVALDWVFVLTKSAIVSHNVLRINRSHRFIRLLRMLRLLRVVKFMSIFDKIEVARRSQTVALFLKVMKRILFILVINHFVACAWYGLSVLSGDFRLNHWVDNLGPDSLEAERPSVAYEYTTSLHWALTQFTPASMEVFPRNAIERAFTITVMLMSLLAFSSVVASMTSTMTQFLQQNANVVKERETLNRFISEHRVSVDLSKKINSYRNREKVRMKRRPVLESQVRALQDLPDVLMRDLHTEIYATTLEKHPLFLELDVLDTEILEMICHKAMQDRFIERRQPIWNAGQAATQMFFVRNGNMRLFLQGAHAVDYFQLSCRAHVKAGDMLSEHALWLTWNYTGDMLSITDVSLFSLSASKFCEVVWKSLALPFLFNYAKLFAGSPPDTDTTTLCDVADSRRLVSRAMDEISEDADLPNSQPDVTHYHSYHSNHSGKVRQFVGRALGKYPPGSRLRAGRTRDLSSPKSQSSR